MRKPDEMMLECLDRMTDSTGLIQHGIYSIPRRESGYTTDDNARALRLCTRLWDRHPDDRMLNRVARYLSFIEFARSSGRGFHNFLSYQRHWLDAEGTGDCQGQVVRALAEVLGSRLPDDYRELARELIKNILPVLADLRSLRAQAYVILACGHLWSAGVTDVEAFDNIAWSAAQRLVECYDHACQPDWKWFEPQLTYANAVLPHALFVAARRWPKHEYGATAAASFQFLDGVTTVENVFWPVGNDGWYSQGGVKAHYDQQPVEATTMAEAALEAWSLLRDEKYLRTFQRAHAWFLGENSLKLPLLDNRTGACCDGLQKCGLNRNQGAESILAWLWTQLQSIEFQSSHELDHHSAVASA